MVILELLVMVHGYFVDDIDGDDDPEFAVADSKKNSLKKQYLEYD